MGRIHQSFTVRNIEKGMTFEASFRTDIERREGDASPVLYNETVIALTCIEDNDGSGDKICTLGEGGPRFALSHNGRMLTALDNAEDILGGIMAGTRLPATVRQRISGGTVARGAA